MEPVTTNPLSTETLSCALPAGPRPFAGLDWLWVGFSLVAAAEFGSLLTGVPGSCNRFPLPAAITLGLLLLQPFRCWLPLVGLAAAAQLLSCLGHGGELGRAAGVAAGLAVEVLIAAGLVRRFVTGGMVMGTLHAFCGFVAMSTLGALAGGTVGSLLAAGSAPGAGFATELGGWMACSSTLFLVATPCLLSWAEDPPWETPFLEGRGRAWEAVGLLLTVAAIAWYLLVIDQGVNAPYKARVVPFVVWAGIRFGTRGATGTVLLLACFAAFLTTHFHVGLSPRDLAEGSYLWTLQTFLVITAVAAIIPAIVVGERDRKVAELRESELRFRNLTAAAFEGVVLSEEGIIVDVNEQVLELLGYDREEMIGREVVAYITPETRALAADSISTGRELASEHRLVRKDGRILEVEARARVLRSRGRTLRMSAFRDVTDRRRSESRERHRAQILDLITSHAPLAEVLDLVTRLVEQENPDSVCSILLVDDSGRRLVHGAGPSLPAFYNEAVHGIMIGEGMGSCGTAAFRGARVVVEDVALDPLWREFANLAARAGLRACWSQPVFGTDRQVLGTFAIYHRSPRSPQPWELESIEAAAGYVRLAIERTQSRLALHANRAKLALAMDMARLGHWELDLATRRFTFSDTFLRLIRTSAEQEHGNVMEGDLYVRRFLPPEVGVRMTEEITRAAASNDPQFIRQLEHPFLGADGTPGIMLVRFSLLRDAAGQVTKIHGVSEDVTELREAECRRRALEDQLRKARSLEALGTLAGGTAHEFNNILGIIQGYADMVKVNLGSGLPVASDLEEIRRAVQRGKEIVDQILTFSQPQTRSRVGIDFAALVEEAGRVVESMLPETIRLELAVSRGPEVVLANATQLHQVILNLCRNSMQALAGRTGRIRVELRPVTLGPEASRLHPDLHPGPHLVLSVADDGDGMSPEVLARVFEPFFTTKAPGEGTGLGLAVVHGIIQAHGGAVLVESTPGRGTTFRTFLPVVPDAVVAPPESSSPGSLPRGDGESVLIVDDEPSLVRVAVRFLERHGYRATGVGSAREALDLFRADPSRFDVVVTDLTMPGMNGVELAAALREVRPDLLVILSTGYGGSKSPPAALTSTISSLLEKPFTQETLLLGVRQLLNRARRGRAPIAADPLNQRAP